MSANAPLEPPYIVSKGARTYYVAADGSAWRVRDTVLESRHHREVKVGSPQANYRLFTNPDGRRLLYQFSRDEARGPSERDFDRQLHASNLELRTKSPDPETVSLGQSGFGAPPSDRPNP
jgi:hypothetical protein